MIDERLFAVAGLLPDNRGQQVHRRRQHVLRPLGLGGRHALGVAGRAGPFEDLPAAFVLTARLGLHGAETEATCQGDHCQSCTHGRISRVVA
jgi:hypothetical protein